MNKSQIKIISVIFGILSLAFSIYSFYTFRALFGSFGSFGSLKYPVFNIDNLNFIFLEIAFTPVVFLLAAILSIGLFKLKRWGKILANIALSFYLMLFSRLLLTHFFPDLFDNSIKSGSWFIFWHFNLRIDTIIVPLCALAFMVFFNFKKFNRNY
ncbi:hypothetical protein [uncultured Desulfosarcina sp.]|uniref:hypothetical protein n=1 Tax=uncultured Desulfosarcina sp. TaxID=218289 RepID=UPI0029C89959|nr:hypothetical protein [uncultured Desulfosarcina sp.]